jgi:hypothetical protein
VGRCCVRRGTTAHTASDSPAPPEGMLKVGHKHGQSGIFMSKGGLCIGHGNGVNTEMALWKHQISALVVKTESRPHVLCSFGDSPGLSSDVCSGPCPLGHYCPIQSTLPTPCPAGRALFPPTVADAVYLRTHDINVHHMIAFSVCRRLLYDMVALGVQARTPM